MMPTTMRLLRQATRFKRSVNQDVACLERFNGDGRIGHGVLASFGKGGKEGFDGRWVFLGQLG